MLLTKDQIVELGGHYHVKNPDGEIIGLMILKAGDVVPPVGIGLDYFELIE